FSPPKALAMAGSPISASIVLNRTFWDFQPIVLKASVRPTAVLLEPPPLPPPPLPLDEDVAVAALVVVAFRLGVFSPSTVTAPAPVPVVVMLLLLTVALAALWTRLVPINPATTRGELLLEPPLLPEDCPVAVTSLVVFAVRVAISLARTTTLPPV